MPAAACRHKKEPTGATHPPAPQVLHVGDRFSDTGNDSATRDCCSILWVANPEETGEPWVGWWSGARACGWHLLATGARGVSLAEFPGRAQQRGPSDCASHTGGTFLSLLTPPRPAPCLAAPRLLHQAAAQRPDEAADQLGLHRVMRLSGPARQTQPVLRAPHAAPSPRRQPSSAPPGAALPRSFHLVSA